MAEQTYKTFVILTLENDDQEKLPDTGDVSDMICDKLSTTMARASGCRVLDIDSYPDSTNSDMPPPVSIKASLDLIDAYVEDIREKFAKAGLLRATEIGLRGIQNNVYFLKGCLSGIAASSEVSSMPMPHIRELTRENLEEAPEPVLHLVAHKMGLVDCAGMDKPKLVEWIKSRMDEETEKHRPN